MERREFIKAGGAAAAATTFGGACASVSGKADKLAYLGGTPVMAPGEHKEGIDHLFAWPVVNDAMRKASDDVLCAHKMSGRDVTTKFQQAFAKWEGSKYGLACINGTTALNTAFYCIGIGPGDEVICPTLTFWASCMGVVNLGGTVVFADIKADDLTVDPKSVEERITARTKAIVVVHYMGMPCDMDAIMAIAKKHNLKVIEDVSHAQGGLYKGRKLGTIGDIGAMSLMSSKAFAIGEAGIMVTDNEEYYKKGILWGKYAEMGNVMKKADFWRTLDVPFGGIKNRLNQCTAAIGLEQLKKYDAERQDIENAMLYWWSQIKDINFLEMIYPKYPNSNKSGWYASRGRYLLEGVDNRVFAEAVNAELAGVPNGRGVGAGCNFPLHWSSVFDSEDLYGKGIHPSRRFLPNGVTPKSLTGTLSVADTINEKVFGDPWFKHCEKPLIDIFVEAIHKVAKNVDKLRGLKPKHDGYSYWNRNRGV